MNITETINLTKDYKNKREFPIELAKPLWDKKQEKTDLTDKQIASKTFSRIKLIQSLVERDTSKTFIDPDKMSMSFRTTLGVKTKKVVPFNIWVDVKAKGKLVFSSVYKDWETGKSIVKFANGDPDLVERGWKQIREHFVTGYPKIVSEDSANDDEVEQEPEIEEPKVEKKAAKKAPAKKETPKAEPKVEKPKKPASKKPPKKAEKIVEKKVEKKNDGGFSAETISNMLEDFDPASGVDVPEIPEELK